MTEQPQARLSWETANGVNYFHLKPGELVVLGRGDENTVVVDSQQVSRKHASIEWNGENFVIRDLGSSNGTFVNGRRVQSIARILRDRDTIALASFAMIFEVSEESESADYDSRPVVPIGGETIIGSVNVRLIASAGPNAGQEYYMTGSSLTIGRASTNATWDIRLEDSTVSRPHARIERQKGTYILTDLGSANGTLVNDCLIVEPFRLRDGDAIGIGKTRLIFRSK